MADLATFAVIALVFGGTVLAVVAWLEKERELTEAQALDKLSHGFEWTYEQPLLIFKLRDGTRLTLDASKRRWRHIDPD